MEDISNVFLHEIAELYFKIKLFKKEKFMNYQNKGNYNLTDLESKLFLSKNRK